MSTCDICSRTADYLEDPSSSTRPKLQLDEDGLWICSVCKRKLTSKPVGDDEGDDLDEETRALVGASAGAVCRTLDLPYSPPYQEIIDAASRIAYDEDRYMSTWTFVTLWMDGTTVWQSEDKVSMAVVHPDGEVRIVQIE